jgi:hypothetical protein
MVRKGQINFRASALTRQQLEQLCEWWGVNQTEAITVAVDRAYREEEARQGRPAETDKEVSE